MFRASCAAVALGLSTLSLVPATASAQTSLHAGELEAPVEGELECALALRPHEHYDYLVVLARTTREWNILCDLLQIGSSVFDKGRGRTKIGFGRAISADKVIERLHRG